jgi:hypothetical protein
LFEAVEKVLAALGGLMVVLAALGGGCWWLFQRFSDRWLKAKFEERLADYKHAQERELEEYKHEHQRTLEQVKLQISTLLDRTVKFHQQEYEVLPELWRRLTDTYHAIQEFTSPEKSYPDLDRMNAAQLGEFFQHSSLLDSDRDEIAKAEHKLSSYIKIKFHYDVVSVRKIHARFYRYLKRNGIFINPELKDRFYEIDDLLSKTFYNYKFNEENNVAPGKTVTDFLPRVSSLYNGLDQEVHDRLWTASFPATK